ncbi:hypothetical protein EP7_002504 [Isosphaeraceae bacterium EP7]
MGTANPERMRVEFWEWMIRGDGKAEPEEDDVVTDSGMIIRDGIVKSGYGPYDARQRFGLSICDDGGPIWTFDRMGATHTRLPDGRYVSVAGEHEDYYDPDFYIYNDVVVTGPGGEIEIYGYPKEIFPPTDFHTATLVDHRIILIGSVGYPDDRRLGDTPVFALDLADYAIKEIQTTGEMPGWIHKHKAECDSEGVITVRRGEVLGLRDGKQDFRRNFEEYALDTRTGVWRRLTDRNWAEFSVQEEEKEIGSIDFYMNTKALFPENVEYTMGPPEEAEWDETRFLVEGVTVSVTGGLGNIRIVIEGQLPDDLVGRITEGMRANMEALNQRKCTITRL